ncbi:MAG: hypothetical protein EOP42_30980, partial [Sphingobacteriaceae bacterium]
MKSFAENSSFTTMLLLNPPTCYFQATTPLNAQMFKSRLATNFLRRTIAFLLFTSCFLFTRAQTFTTTVAQSTIGKNQYAEVAYEMSNASSIDNFQVPQYKDWIVVSGPMSSSYQSSINGQVSQRTTMTYYLQPKHSGNLIVEGATATLNGKPVRSSNKSIQVLEKNVSTPPAGSNNAQQVDPFGNLLNDPFFAQPAQRAQGRDA